jgi:serine/threonine-protein kinase
VEESILARDAPRPRGLPADLATILQKALRRVPAERYATVAAFAEDLARWTRGEPVLAQPDSAWYRARRFVGRNRAWVVTAAAVAVLLVAASVISLWQAQVATRQSALAQKEAAKAKAVQAFLLDLFNANRSTQADPLRAQQTTARDLLDHGAASVDEALKDAPESRIEVLQTLSDMYDQLGLIDRAADLAGRRADLARQIYGGRDVRTAEAILALTNTIADGAGRSRIPGLLKEALAVLEVAGPGHDSIRAYALIQAARYWRYESLPEARRSADEAVQFFEVHQGEPGDLVTALLLAGMARHSAGASAEAEPLFQRAIDQATDLGDAALAWRTGPLGSLGLAQLAQWKFGAAETSLRAALAQAATVHGEGHPSELSPAVRLVQLLRVVGRADEARALEERLGRALERPDPRYDQATRLDLQGSLAESLLLRGRPDLGLAPLEAKVGAIRSTVPGSAAMANAQRRLATALALMGRLDEASKAQGDAESTWRRLVGRELTPDGTAPFALSRAEIEMERGEPAAALQALEAVAGVAGPSAVERDVLRSRALRSLGREGEALAAAEAAVASLAAMAEGSRPVAIYAEALQARGQAQLATGDAPAAAASLEAALALRRANDAPGSLWMERNLLALAEAREAGHDLEGARRLRAEARGLRRVREGAQARAVQGDPAHP